MKPQKGFLVIIPDYVQMCPVILYKVYSPYREISSNLNLKKAKKNENLTNNCIIKKPFKLSKPNG